MKVACISLAATLALSGCATTPGEVPAAGAGDDCAVIAAVAREHYRFGPDNPPPPLWLQAGTSGWAPQCDWSRYGVAFPEIYDPLDRPASDGGMPRDQWVSFQRPIYDGHGAVIESGVLYGPLAGEGVRCRVRSGFAGWTVERCEQDWIS